MHETDLTEDTAKVAKNANSIDWARPTGVLRVFVRFLVTPN